MEAPKDWTNRPVAAARRRVEDPTARARRDRSARPPTGAARVRLRGRSRPLRPRLRPPRRQAAGRDTAMGMLTLQPTATATARAMATEPGGQRRRPGVLRPPAPR